MRDSQSLMDDATVAGLVKHRELAPEQQENKNKLEQLYQVRTRPALSNCRLI